jgi:LuxR family maltose regulon positive regulatory protein
MPSKQQPDWFPQTKLYPPRLSDDVLQRPRLLNALHWAVTTKRLTLLSAPAGSGKTTAMAALSQSYPDVSMAWISLDEDDNDPLTFLKTLLASIQRCCPKCGHNLELLLSTPSATGFEVRRMLGLLINDILAAAPEILILVLDDLQRVSEPAIHQALDFLLEYLPPCLHLVVTTRSDPPLSLSRLRARGELAEFRMDALRFTHSEMQTLFNDLLQLGLASDDLISLQQRTEGWVAGVRLLTLSLPRLDTAKRRADLIHYLAQSRRFLFDYLVDEVLNQLEPDIHDFLLQTSILTELTPSLCEAVTQRADSARVLDTLYRQNLFLVITEMDSDAPFAEPIYRYHALFAQFLHRNLHQKYASRILELHRRAAEAHPDPVQAIHHYLQAQLWAQAAERIIPVARQELHHGLLRAATLRWVEALPQSIRDDNPWLQLFVAAYLGQQGALEKSFARLQDTIVAFRRQGDVAGELICLNRMLMAKGNRDMALTEKVAQFHAAHPDLVRPHDQAYLNLVRCWAYIYHAEWDRVDFYLRQLLPLIRDNPSLHHFLATSLGPQLLFADSGMRPIEALAEMILQRYGDGESLVHAGAYAQLTSIRFYQARLDEALDYARRARHIIHAFGGLAWMDMVPDYVCLFAYLVQGDYAAFHHYLDERWADIARDESLADGPTANYLYLRGCALWHEQRLAEAQIVMDQIEQVQRTWYERPSRVINLMGAWLALAEGRFVDGERLLHRATRRHAQDRETILCSHPRLNLASLYWLWYVATHDEAHRRSALYELEQVLAEAKQREMPGLLLQSGRVVVPLLQNAQGESHHPGIISQVLAVFGEEGRPRPLPIPHTGNTLTPREVEVLRLLMAGASNRDIGAQLVITPRTAKAHVSSILQKLQVSSRSEAAARARELALM